MHVLVGAQPVRNFICGTLASAGVDPIALGSAYQYLAQSQAESPACLILSLELPDMSGLELQRRIADRATVVFVSEQADMPASVHAIRAGAVDFLVTPIDPLALVRTVRAAIEQDRRRRAERVRVEELRNRYGELTPREREALPLIASGLLNKQAASILGISPITLQIHRGRIMRKLAARSFAELVRIADRIATGEKVAG